MFKKMIVGGMLAMSMACGQFSKNESHHYELYIDPAFSDDQSAAIISAATEWQTKLGNFITFSGTTDDKGNDTIAVYAADGMTTLAKDCNGDGDLGCEWPDGVKSHIYVPMTLDAATFRQVSLHEIGHSLGADHIGPGNVMCASKGCAAMTVQCPKSIEPGVVGLLMLMLFRFVRHNRLGTISIVKS